MACELSCHFQSKVIEASTMSNNMEVRVLMRHGPDLLQIIHNPITLAHQLLSCEIITDEVISRCNGNEGNYMKASWILEAVRGHVRVQGKASFVKFVKVLNNEPAMKPVVEKLLATYRELGGKFPLSELKEEGACGTGSSSIERHYHRDDRSKSPSTQSAAMVTTSNVSSTTDLSCHKPPESLDEWSGLFGPPPYEEHCMDQTATAEVNGKQPRPATPQPRRETNGSSASSVCVYGGTELPTPFILSSDGTCRPIASSPSLPILGRMSPPPSQGDSHGYPSEEPNGATACNSHYQRSHSECLASAVYPLSTEVADPSPSSPPTSLPNLSTTLEAEMPTDNRPSGSVAGFMRRKAKGARLWAKGAATDVKNAFSRRRTTTYSNEVTLPSSSPRRESGCSSMTLNHQVSVNSGGSCVERDRISVIEDCELTWGNTTMYYNV